MPTGTPLSLGVQMIALNDENYMESALRSLLKIKPDYVAIVDGGSTDKTQDIIRGYSDALNILTETIPWANDFARQRNNTLALGPAVDWFMRLDTDEFLPSNVKEIRRVLAALPGECLAVRVKQVNLYPDRQHYAANLGGWETHPRIFRGNLSRLLLYRWVGQVHESLYIMTTNGLKPIPESKIWDWNVSVFHSGWISKARRQDREKLYQEMPGSGIKVGDLTDRHYEIRELPAEIFDK